MKWFEVMKKRLPFPYWLFVLVMFWPFFALYFVYASFLARPKKQKLLRVILALFVVVWFLGFITFLNEQSESKQTTNIKQIEQVTESSEPKESTKPTSSVTKPEIKDSRTLEEALVVAVIDGDTIDVNLDGKTERVRLIGVDTPEVADPRKPVQCFGKEASNFTRASLAGKTIWLEADKTQGERDKYGRLLRFVWIDETKTDFNKKLIADGFAHQYTYNTPYKYRDEYLEAERKAESSNLGLWNDQICPKEVSVPVTQSVVKNANCQYACSGPDKDCKDFKTQVEAQNFFECCGFSATNDPMRLDNAKGNGNGRACESLK